MKIKWQNSCFFQTYCIAKLHMRAPGVKAKNPYSQPCPQTCTVPKDVGSHSNQTNGNDESSLCLVFFLFFFNLILKSMPMHYDI